MKTNLTIAQKAKHKIRLAVLFTLQKALKKYNESVKILRKLFIELITLVMKFSYILKALNI